MGGSSTFTTRPRAARSEENYAQMLEFGRALPRARKAVSADLRRRGLPQRRILAAVAGLLDETAVRVGNDEYARENGTVGRTTLRQSNVEIGRSRVVLDFVGKGGKRHTIALSDPRIARVRPGTERRPSGVLFSSRGASPMLESCGNGARKLLHTAGLSGGRQRTMTSVVWRASSPSN